MTGVNGFILLNKGKGVSSHSALTPLKKLMPKKTKIGHTGTLDPNATGLLPVAIGRASKFIQYLGNHPKKYRAGFKFGIKTDTADNWGSVIEKQAVEITLSSEAQLKKLDLLREAIKSFIGEIEQVPPMYSAIKKNGKALYKYAREGVEIERKARLISIYKIDIIEFNYPDVIIDVECSKGTYIRTLIEDITQSINELATMTSLIRLQSDGFDLKNAVTIEQLKSESDVVNNLVKIEDVFTKLPNVKVDETHEKHIKNGVPVDLNRFQKNDFELPFGLYTVVNENNKMFALAQRNKDNFKTLIVI